MTQPGEMSLSGAPRVETHEWRNNGLEIIIISEEDCDPLPILRRIRYRRMSLTEKASGEKSVLGTHGARS